MQVSYILPVKWDAGQDTAELTGYLSYLATHVDLIIVDGSSADNYQLHKAAWGDFGRHIAPASELKFINGKVNGVITGLRTARHNKVIIADDDVRYSLEQIMNMERLLEHVQLVVPQNYFSPAPWHAQWDTARTLLNRALYHDYPGTLAIQRDFINPLGGYDGDVMFENLELIRTVQAAYGKIHYKDDMFVERLPPSEKHFWSQRVRQAFDDYAQPLKLSFFFLLLPALLAAALVSLWLPVVLLSLSIVVAETGRRLSKGTKVFSAVSSFYAPCWLLERGVCTWIAFFQKIKVGGCLYNNKVIATAANPVWKIRSKLKVRALVESIPMKR